MPFLFSNNMSDSYYLVRNNIQYGPFTLEQLTAQGLTYADFVWHEGLPDWVPAASLPELAKFVTTMPQRPFATPQVAFDEAISGCFKKFATFKGRARRSEYWWFQLFCFLLSIVTCGIGYIVVLIPNIAVTVRRLHDVGRSGWWWGICFLMSLVYGTCFYFTIYQLMAGNEVPISLTIATVVSHIANLILGITLFVFTLLDSKRGTNRYGDSPKYPNG